jgi:hypothetical protein
MNLIFFSGSIAGMVIGIWVALAVAAWDDYRLENSGNDESKDT